MGLRPLTSRNKVALATEYHDRRHFERKAIVNWEDETLKEEAIEQHVITIFFFPGFIAHKRIALLSTFSPDNASCTKAFFVRRLGRTGGED